MGWIPSNIQIYYSQYTTQSFNETSWLPQRLLVCRCMVSLAEIFHLSFPCGLWGINVLPTCQLTFTTFQLPTINVYSRMYPQLQWNLTFFWGVMMELLDTSLTRCQRIVHFTNFVSLSRLNWKSCWLIYLSVYSLGYLFTYIYIYVGVWVRVIVRV